MSAYDGYKPGIGSVIAAIVLTVIISIFITPLIALPVLFIMLLFAGVRAVKHTIAFKIALVGYVLFGWYTLNKHGVNCNWANRQYEILTSHDLDNSSLNNELNNTVVEKQ